jgi:hypothetical protein
MSAYRLEKDGEKWSRRGKEREGVCAREKG